MYIYGRIQYKLFKTNHETLYSYMKIPCRFKCLVRLSKKYFKEHKITNNMRDAFKLNLDRQIGYNVVNILNKLKAYSPPTGGVNNF